MESHVVLDVPSKQEIYPQMIQGRIGSNPLLVRAHYVHLGGTTKNIQQQFVKIDATYMCVCVCV